VLPGDRLHGQPSPHADLEGHDQLPHGQGERPDLRQGARRAAPAVRLIDSRSSTPTQFSATEGTRSMNHPVDAGSNSKRFSISVPTSTVIAIDPGDPYRVCVIEQVKKHGGRLTLVGGRVELPAQDHMTCALVEWDQEAGGKGAILVNPRLWAVKTDPKADIRESTLGKLTHELCPEELRAVPVHGHYGVPDRLHI